jgi:hypothetical protein
MTITSSDILANERSEFRQIYRLERPELLGGDPVSWRPIVDQIGANRVEPALCAWRCLGEKLIGEFALDDFLQSDIRSRHARTDFDQRPMTHRQLANPL